mmetsp:Transcript_59758/g.90091  ORF Transcript_59758/g.90091 Transcript_59758/m.90091 type:complete len:127 (-) Transcript_59758:90-470(-)
MSWQSYVDDSLVGTGEVRRACLLGLDGSVWAKSADFNIDGNESVAIATAAANPSSVMGSSLQLAGQKFMVLRTDDNVIYCRKNQDGLCICKTNQAVVVGWYDEKQSAGNCNKVVEGLADYLRENNF